MTPQDALDELRAMANPTKAEGEAQYHKADREYLGVGNPEINEIAMRWRKELNLDLRIDVARFLWDSNSHEARVAAAKLLTQARIRPDDAVWRLIVSWVPQFDAWAIADHVCSAGGRRLIANPDRLDQVDSWTRDPNMWVRRAALVMTLPWTKMTHPDDDDLARRDRILGWAASYVPDRDWFIQKAIAWWLRDLSKHDPDRVRAFLDQHGGAMKAFARKEAGKYLKG